MPTPTVRRPIPARAGIGARSPHIREILATRPSIGWVEVHAENYMVPGGHRLAELEGLAAHYPLSIHGVGLSLGSADGIDPDHLERLRQLVDRFQPGLVSEHVAWSVNGGVYLNDLLPLPYTEGTVSVVADNVARVQDALGRRILIENPSSYLAFAATTLDEGEFLAEIVRRTGCGVLLDLNNIHVSASNLDADADGWLDRMPLAAVGEVHLAGPACRDIGGRTLLIDDHGSRVPAPVWRLYDVLLTRLGPVPTLVEWDTDLPPLAVLLDEAAAAERRLAGAIGEAADAA